MSMKNPLQKDIKKIGKIRTTAKNSPENSIMDISDNNMNQISVYKTKSRLTTYKRMFNIKKNKTNLISKKKLN